jgi:CxxC motif-containing protein
MEGHVGHSVNPNINCLAGKRCPKCSSYGPFEIMVSMRVLLHDTGTDYAEDGTTEFGNDARTICDSCRYEGLFADFEDKRT